MATALDWLDVLNRSALQSASPLIAYAAEQRRKAELADQNRHEDELVDRRAKAYAQQMADEYQMKSATEQKVLRDNALSEARELGVTAAQLPETATYVEIREAMGKARGRQLIEAAKTASSAVKAYADYRGETADEITKRAAQKAIGSLTPKEKKAAKLSDADINKIVEDRSSIDDLLSKAIREKNDAAVTLLNRINGEMAADISAELAVAEKSNPRLSGLAENFKAAHDDYLALRKAGHYDEASGIEASKALVRDAFNRPQRKQRQGLPAPPLRTSAVPTADSSDRGLLSRMFSTEPVAPSPARDPSTFNPIQRWYYGLDQPGGWPGAMTPTSSVNAPTMGTPRLSLTPAPAGSMPALFPGTNIPIDPSVLSAFKLQSILNDSATNQNSLFPTAFPRPAGISP